MLVPTRPSLDRHHVRFRIRSRHVVRSSMSSVSAIAFGLIAAVRVIWLTGPDAFSDDPFPPTRVITRGPSHHWFGYYDKHQFDPSGRYVLGMRVDFEHRSPEPDDVIGVGML